MIVKAKKYGNSHVFPISKQNLKLFDLKDDAKYKLKIDNLGVHYLFVNENEEKIEQAVNNIVKNRAELLQRLSNE